MEPTAQSSHGQGTGDRALRFTKLVLTVGVLSLTMTAAGSVAVADSAQRKACTTGEALSNLQAPLQHIIGDFSCQYRLFLDGRTFTYCEDDLILGGINPLAEYKALGWSREEATADLERTADRVWIDGVEQSLVRTLQGRPAPRLRP